MRRLYGLCVVLTFLSGCASSVQRSAANDATLAEALKTAAQERAEYRIAPDDILDVSVYPDKDLDVKARVGADGRITVPLAGQISVGGQTIAQAQDAVASKLSTYIVKPQVAVNVDAYGSKQLFVLGEVQKPGPYAIPSGTQLTLLQAITDAGGFTKNAAPRKAHVLRYVDGRSRDYQVDIKALIRHGDREKDMVLEPNDVVYVPQSLF